MIQNKYIHLAKDDKITIGVFSDIHYQKNYKNDRLNSIFENLKEHKPNYICIVGDLLDQGNVLEDKINNDYFIEWIHELSIIAPLIIVLGNHDVGVRKSKWTYYNPQKMIEKLSYLPNVYLLDNDAIVKDKICFIGYTPPYTYYGKDNQENVQNYVDDIDQQLSHLLVRNCYNVLLCHTPLYVTNDEVQKTMVVRESDLVLSGHMHNGILPFSFSKNYGLISPHKKFFPKYARGYLQKNNHHYVISGGVITFSGTAPKILHFMNRIFPMHIEYIKIDPMQKATDDINVYQKVKR